jgi:hypothetical protein
MNDHQHDVAEQLERLCAGYRACVEEPTVDAAEQRLLRAAGRTARRRSLLLSVRAYAPASMLVVGAIVLVLATTERIGSPVRYSAATEPPVSASAQSVRVLATNDVTPPSAAANMDVKTEALDLNSPDALAALRNTRPRDYAYITAILAGIAHREQQDVPGWLQADFGAQSVIYEPIWLTSFPPKRFLSFALDDRRYRAVLTIINDEARVLPVDHAAP